MGLSGTVLQICLRFTHEGKHDKKTDCKSASKRIIMMQVALPIFPVSRIRVYMHGNYSAQWYISVKELINSGYYDLATAYQSAHVNY